MFTGTLSQPVFRALQFKKFHGTIRYSIQGKLFGKESKHPAVDKTQAILPLPASLAGADAIIVCKIHNITPVCVPPSGIMFGAQKRTQVLDIAYAVQLPLEKGGDNHGAAGLAQGDIASF